MEVFRKVILVIIAAVFSLEVPGRFMTYLLIDKQSASAPLSSAYPDSLKEKFTHDFIDPKTRIKYDYDMFLGWRAKPSQQGFTYRINANGHRDNIDYDRLGPRLILLTGGSAAWSLGAPDNDHILSAYLQERINRGFESDKQLQVLNLAEQAYGMKQENRMVLDYVHKNPMLVIYYDGVNDLQTIVSGKNPHHYRTWGHFEDVLRTSLKNETSSSFVLSSTDIAEFSITYRSARRMLSRVTGNHTVRQPELSQDQRNLIRQFFREQIIHNSRILAALGIKSLFVLQPIGFIDKPLHPRERFDHYHAAWWRAAYDLLEEEYVSLDGHNGISTLSLVHVFRNESRHVFLDPTHTNEFGNQIISEALARKAHQILEPEMNKRPIDTGNRNSTESTAQSNTWTK